jgi:hypothetical protein
VLAELEYMINKGKPTLYSCGLGFIHGRYEITRLLSCDFGCCNNVYQIDDHPKTASALQVEPTKFYFPPLAQAAVLLPLAKFGIPLEPVEIWSETLSDVIYKLESYFTYTAFATISGSMAPRGPIL